MNFLKDWSSLCSNSHSFMKLIKWHWDFPVDTTFSLNYSNDTMGPWTLWTNDLKMELIFVNNICYWKLFSSSSTSIYSQIFCLPKQLGGNKFLLTSHLLWSSNPISTELSIRFGGQGLKTKISYQWWILHTILEDEQVPIFSILLSSSTIIK